MAKKELTYKQLLEITPGPGKTILIKKQVGSRFSGKKGVIIKPMPQIGNGYLVQIGKDKAFIFEKEIEKVIKTRK